MACALGFLAGAAYHVAGLVRPEVAEPAPPWRHTLFVGINVAAGVGMLLRPPFFVWLFGVLTIQQLFSHATYGWGVWTGEGRIDWASVIVVIAMPALFALLVADARGRRRDRPPRA